MKGNSNRDKIWIFLEEFEDYVKDLRLFLW